MKKFLYIVYLGFLVGAARRFSTLMKIGVGMQLRDTYYPPREYTVRLDYEKTMRIEAPDGDHYDIAIVVNSGLSRTFVCRRAYGYYDVILLLKKRMNKYIKQHYGSLGLGYRIGASQFQASPNFGFELNVKNLDSADVECINKAFKAMPREL